MTTRNLKTAAILSVFLVTTGFAAISNAGMVSKEPGSTVRNIIPDSAITASIKSDFLADKAINGLSIHVETINGVVTLTGTVPNSEMKMRAESIAQSTDGVKEVISKLRIK